MECPKCKNTYLLICDNDCNTYKCLTCYIEFYMKTHTNDSIHGHNPSCGLS